MESYNIPEFINGRIRLSPHDFVAVAGDDPLKAKPKDPLDSLKRWEMQKVNIKRNPGEKSIHE